MRYHINGRTMNSIQLHEYKNYELNTNYEAEKVAAYVEVQRKLNAKRRMEAETNPRRKAEMEELFDDGNYDFDFYFGEDPNFMD